MENNSQPLLIGGDLIAKFSFYEDLINEVMEMYNLSTEKTCILSDTEDPELYMDISFNYKVLNVELISKDALVAYSEIQHFFVVLPKYSPLAKVLYFVMPFKRLTWLCIVLGILYNSLMLTIAQRNFPHFTINLLDSLQVMISQGFKITKKDQKFYFAYFFVILYGFFITNLYLSSLGCFMMTSMTLKDFEILVPEAPFPFEKELSDIRIQYTSLWNLINHILMMDLNFGYLLNEGMWNVNPVLNDFFIRYGEEKVDIWFGALIKQSSSHLGNVTGFFINMSSLGYMDKWRKNAFTIPIDLKSLNYEDTRLQMLTVSDLKICFYMYWIGMSTAIVIWIIELLIKRFS